MGRRCERQIVVYGSPPPKGHYFVFHAHSLTARRRLRRSVAHRLGRALFSRPTCCAHSARTIMRRFGRRAASNSRCVNTPEQTEDDILICASILTCGVLRTIRARAAKQAQRCDAHQQELSSQRRAPRPLRRGRARRPRALAALSTRFGWPLPRTARQADNAALTRRSTIDCTAALDRLGARRGGRERRLWGAAVEEAIST